MNHDTANIITDVHLLEIDEVLAKFGSNKTTGLSDGQANELYKKHGPNSLSLKKNQSKIFKIFVEMFSGMNLILNLGGVLCTISYIVTYIKEPVAEIEHLYLGMILLIIALFSTLFGHFQEAKSLKLMDSFSKLLPKETVVIRNSHKHCINSDLIVVGDIICLSGGDMIPADVRIISANSFKVDNSSLTGESEPQYRFPNNSNTNYIEAENMAFAFTHVIEGTATGIVIATGDKSMIGQIAGMTSNIPTHDSTLSKDIKKFIKILTIVSFVIGIIFFLLAYYIKKSGLISAVVFFIGILVANIPEGLVVTVTFSLALTAKRMAKKNIVVKQLESVETLGNSSVICSDKTGTITQNKMTVSHIWVDEKVKNIICKNSRQSKEKLSKTEKYLSLVICLCNRADYREIYDDRTPIYDRLTIGDPTESALLKFYDFHYGTPNVIRKRFTKLHEIPFNSNTKINLCIHQNSEQHIITVKGAPERVLDRCTTVMINNEHIDLSFEWRDKILSMIKTFGDKGERVLGIAFGLTDSDIYRKVIIESNEDNNNLDFELCFLGLVSLIDPPRPSVPLAIEMCKSAGIRVIMMTGDHPVTARSISQLVGIITQSSVAYKEISESVKRREIHDKNNSLIMTGEDLYQISSNDLDYILRNYFEIVFSRISPRQKLLIVESLQRNGEVVAVTGDGVNDSPALRKANIGIAMGITGTDVAKNASDIILLDDNFSSIITGVKEGRLIFDNLKKSVAYTLTSTIPELIPFILNIVLGIPLPLGTLSILCIDFITDLVPALSLVYEKAETNIMSRKPRKVKKERLVGTVLIRFTYFLIGTLQTLAAMLSYLFLTLDNGFKWKDLQQWSKWKSKDVLYVTDSYGQEWSYASRLELENSCYSTYYLSLVIIQWADLIISKTRTMSLFKHGFFNNKVLIIALLAESLVSFILVYVKPLCYFINLRPINPIYLIPSIIFAILLWILDEIRRYFVRKYPNGFIYQETYY